MTERTKNIDVAKIYNLWKEYAAACNAGNIEWYMALWIEDGIQMLPGRPRQVGLAEIRKEMQPQFNFFDVRDMTFQTDEIRILGDWAFSHGTYDFVKTSKEDGETRKYSGKFLGILRKQVDGSWKIAIDCFNKDKLVN